MQYVDCVVRLSGDIGFQVPKTDIPVAEVALLRAMHGGDDGVVNIVPGRTTREPAAKVKRALLEKYNGTSGADLIEKLFPGMDPRLPKTLRDIGMALDVSTMDAKPLAGPRPVRIEVEPDAAEAAEEIDEDADDGSSYAREDAARAAREMAGEDA